MAERFQDNSLSFHLLSFPAKQDKNRKFETGFVLEFYPAKGCMSLKNYIILSLHYFTTHAEGNMWTD